MLTRYFKWLHTGWPAGTVEKLPLVNEDGSTKVAGLYVVGDLTGIPLLKFSAHTGAKAVQTIVEDPAFSKRKPREGVRDLVIIGGGVSGFAAALEAKKHNLNFVLLEAAEPFSTLENFPKQKPIYTYPTDMEPAGDMQFTTEVKEALIEELHAQTTEQGMGVMQARAEQVTRSGGLLQVDLAGDDPIPAHRVIVAIGRSGNFRKLGVPGEESDKVFNRLHDPKEFKGQEVLVVGGGDSALEAAIALAGAGANVNLSYRKAEFSRPKPDNIEALNDLAGEAKIILNMGSRVTAIEDDEVVLDTREGEQTLKNDAVFTLIGREAPLDFFRRSGVPIAGEWTAKSWLSLVGVLLAAVFVYHWKKGGVYFGINELFSKNNWFPFNVPAWWEARGGAFADPAHLLGVLKISVGDPGFFYSLAYCLAVGFFGWRRIKRRKTPYVTLQTWTLILVQVIPLFLLPYLLLPWMGNNGWFDAGLMKSLADEFFPLANYGHGREYWRAFGFILAWPLFFWNVFTHKPMTGWLIVSLIQTFGIIPFIVWRWGKGAYCGWICSCGALAETMGDTLRHKMPHGKNWNRLNILGQVFLVFAFVLLGLKVVAWYMPTSKAGVWFTYLFKDIPALNYVWFVDLLWAGILGVGLYWHFSGRVWCRFACPLAALMHIYARFSRFRIFADKKKCISCNVCTSVCHQGIDIMNFANKGLPMEDPECVRCSACVQSCPTGVLTFGQIRRKDGTVIALDKIAASPVQIAEK